MLAEEEKDSVRVTLPYVKGISETLMRWILARANIETTFRPLGQQLVKLKDPISPKRNSKANVVYSIPCKDCSAVFIGQTCYILKS